MTISIITTIILAAIGAGALFDKIDKWGDDK